MACAAIQIIFTLWRHQMETFSALLSISSGNSPVPGEFPTHKGQWRGALMFSLMCVWINGWINNGKAGDLRRYRAHYVRHLNEKINTVTHNKHTVTYTCQDIQNASISLRLICQLFHMANVIGVISKCNLYIYVLLILKDAYLMKTQQCSPVRFGPCYQMCKQD